MNNLLDENAHGTLFSYTVGFVLSIIVTLLAFATVSQQWFSAMGSMIFIVSMAIVQLFVQLVLFLHLNVDSKPFWNVSALIFAFIIVFVIVAASIWIMHNLNANMV